MDCLKKYLTKEYHNEFTITGPSNLLLILGALCTPIVAFFFAVFHVFKQSLKVILYIYYADEFNGVLSGADTAFAIEQEECKAIVNGIMFVKSPTKTDVLKMVKKRIQEKVFENPDDYKKMRSTHHNLFGYIYLLKSEYNVDDCVRTMEMDDTSESISKEQLLEYLENHGQDPLPKNNKVLWEVQVSQKPMLTETQNEFIYPVLYKLNHMIADGVSLISFVSKVIQDGNPKQYVENVMDKRHASENQSSKISLRNIKQAIQNAISSIGLSLHLIYVGLGFYIFYRYVKPKDNNGVHGTKLSGEKHYIWITEKTPKFIATVKNIKTIAKTSFSEVLFTAQSASVCDYLREKGFEIPETFCIAIPVLASLRKVSQKGPAILENNMSMAFMTLPGVRDSLCTTLRAVKEEVAHMRKTRHFEISYWLLNYLMEPFPMPIVSQISKQDGVSMIVSVLPGTEKATAFDGLEMHEAFFATVNRWKAGITWSIFSYDNKFHVGLMIDKAVVADKSDAQKIGDNFLKNISMLDDEVRRKYQ